MRLVLSVRLAWLSTLPLIYASYFATQIRPSFSLLFYSVDSYVKGDLNRATVMMLMFVVPLLSLTRSPSFSNPSPLLGFESKEQVENCWVVRITNPPVSFFNCSMSNGQSITLCWPASKISRMVTSDECPIEIWHRHHPPNPYHQRTETVTTAVPPTVRIEARLRDNGLPQILLMLVTC